MIHQKYLLSHHGSLLLNWLFAPFLLDQCLVVAHIVSVRPCSAARAKLEGSGTRLAIHPATVCVVLVPSSILMNISSTDFGARFAFARSERFHVPHQLLFAIASPPLRLGLVSHFGHSSL